MVEATPGSCVPACICGTRTSKRMVGAEVEFKTHSWNKRSTSEAYEVKVLADKMRVKWVKYFQGRGMVLLFNTENGNMACCKSSKHYLFRNQWLYTTLFQNHSPTEHVRQVLGPWWTTIETAVTFPNNLSWWCLLNFGMNYPHQQDKLEIFAYLKLSWSCSSVTICSYFSLFYMWNNYVILIYRRK